MKFNEYLAFLLLYAATIDQILKEEEKEIIFRIVEQSEYKEIKRSFDKLNDYERIQIIQADKDKFITTKEDKENILFIVKKVFLADDEYLAIERAIFMSLRRLFDIK
jgi:hypothetical protein